MNRRWRRLLVALGALLATAGLVIIGLLLWLYQSGRLATLSQDLLQRLSGQEVTIETLAFSAWNAVTVTNVRLQQRVGGWQISIDCPRLDASYGLTGLFNKRVDHLRLHQPRVVLWRQADATSPAAADDVSEAQPLAALPLERLSVQHGTLQVHWDSQVITWQALDITAHAQGKHQLQAHIRGRLQGSNAPLQAEGQVRFDSPQPTGRLHLVLTTVPLPELARVLPQTPLSTWQVTQGTFDLEADLSVQDGTLQGRTTLALQQVTAEAPEGAVRQASVATEAAIEAHVGRQTLRLDGQAQVRAAQIGTTAQWRMRDVALTTRATLHLDGRQHTLRAEGQVQLQVGQAHPTAGTVMTAGTLATDATLQATYREPTWHMEGEAHVEAEHLSQAPDLTLNKVSLKTPWRLSHTAAQWHLSVTPMLQSHTADLGTLLHAGRLSVHTTEAIEVQHDAQGLHLQGAPEIAVATLEVQTPGPDPSRLQITGLQGRLPLQGNATTIDMTETQWHTQRWQRLTSGAVELLPRLSLQASARVHLQQQRVVVRGLTATLPALGDIRGSGTWHWPSQTLHDLRLHLGRSAIDGLQKWVQPLLPERIRAWQLAGHTELDLQASRLSLQAPPYGQNLVLQGQVQDGAFSSPDTTYAGEHLNGTLHATASLDPAAGQYTLQGTFTLQPFALLIGSFFPAIEDQRITSVLTFSGAYRPASEQVQVYLAGQFGDLGRLTVQGMLHHPMATPQVDMQLALQEVRAGPVWKTFLADATRFPALSQITVQGLLNGALRLRGPLTPLRLEGNLDVTQGAIEAGNTVLSGVSLVLPLQVQYPFPDTPPPSTPLPPEQYGRLTIAAARLGGVELERLSVGLRLHTDSLLLQDNLYIPLWGGQVVIEPVATWHLLQPQRHIVLRVRLHDLNLQRLPRGSAKLPLAGMVTGDFPHLQIRGERLETAGSLAIRVAGGVIRLADLEAQELFSALATWRCSIATEEPLSLQRLTEIYPIGGIGGTLHFRVSDLTLTAGEPAAFSLDFAVQEKDGERREITLRALNNLLFTTGASVASGLLGDTYRLPYRRFGAIVSLRHDTLRLRGKYHDQEGKEYFMQAPALGGGVTIVNRVPENGIPFRDFLQRLKATIVEKPSVQVK